jgi:hypothetical protein
MTSRFFLNSEPYSSRRSVGARVLIRTVALSMVIAVIALFAWAPEASAYPRYNDGCQNCHGAFTSDISPKGSVFPSNSKHEMHRSSSSMNTTCNLCHTNGDNRNPFLGSSQGTNANPVGVGCVGCHGREEDAGNDSVSAGRGAGLRQHHTNEGIGTCAGCHSDANPASYTPVGEDVIP